MLSKLTSLDREKPLYVRPPKDSERPIMDHIVELSIRLKRIFIAIIVIGFVLSVIPVDTKTYVPLISYFPNYIINQVVPQTIHWRGQTYHVQLIQYNPFAGFNILIKSALLLGLLGASPIIAKEIYEYVEPALYPSEKKALKRYSIVAIGLFSLGVIVAIKIVMPVAFKFTIITSLAVVGESRLVAFTDVGQLLTTIILIAIATGIAFEAPLIVYVLISLGIINEEWFHGDNLKYVIFGSMLLGAAISPDPSGIGMLVIGGLFAIAIIVAAKLAARKKKSKNINPVEE